MGFFFLPQRQICSSNDHDEGGVKHRKFCSDRSRQSGASVGFHSAAQTGSAECSTKHFVHCCTNAAQFFFCFLFYIVNFLRSQLLFLCLLIRLRSGSVARSWTSRPSWTPGLCRRASLWSPWRSEVERSGSVRSATSRRTTPPSLKGKESDSSLLKAAAQDRDFITYAF